jgi:hypothetical protein
MKTNRWFWFALSVLESVIQFHADNAKNEYRGEFSKQPTNPSNHLHDAAAFHRRRLLRIYFYLTGNLIALLCAKS